MDNNNDIIVSKMSPTDLLSPKDLFVPSETYFLEIFHPKTPVCQKLRKVSIIFDESRSFYLNDPYIYGFVTEPPPPPPLRLYQQKGTLFFREKRYLKNP